MTSRVHRSRTSLLWTEFTEVSLDILYTSPTLDIMARRGYSTTVGKFAKAERDKQRSDIRRLGELLRYEQKGPKEDHDNPCATPHQTDSHPSPTSS
jgi:hypothetical protein